MEMILKKYFTMGCLENLNNLIIQLSLLAHNLIIFSQLLSSTIKKLFRFSKNFIFTAIITKILFLS